MNILTGGAAVAEPAYPYSGGVPNTVNPADTILPPDGNMQYMTIALESDQIELVATAAKTLNKNSLEESSELSKLLSLLRETINLPVEKAQLSRQVRLMPRERKFDVKKHDFVFAILLADSETTKHVTIISPISIRYNWPKDTACILPREWSVLPGKEDLYAYLVPIGFE
ncbi:uncharacterized protein BBA_10257 [Beauveria bassiana ARSEF 2860]|uniref:Uncharacterized protein n=1 Tax=Beauveria bassiana (strain ARSEF 2860) TaxID=655819 RepID=J4KKP2_BEAB2|nr:uncharacterized protein BBA_10257 [Beauveria bassiana ARSEF 2860]EJP60799.1 hypothetical protein BBA_10257 [Beauveria bassiana ARSEF 2860]